MSQTSLNKTFYEPVVTDRWVHPCTFASTNTVVLAASAYLSRVTCDPEKRVRPATLKASLTSRARQTTTVWRHSLQHKATTLTVMCPDGKRRSYVRDQQTLQSWFANLPTLPTIDWGQAVRNKIKNRNVSFAENIGEWREAVQNLKSGSNVMKKSWAAAKWLWKSRSHRRRWFRRFRKTGLMGKVASGQEKMVWMDLVSAHLSVKFGILPYINQIEEAISVLEQKRQQAFRVQVTLGKTVTKTTKGYYGGSASASTRHSKRAVVYVKLVDNADDFVAGNLAESIWAGTRLSFMIDWFLNVGSYLSSLDAMNMVQDVYGTLTTRTVTTVTDNKAASGYTVLRPARYRYKAVERSLISSVPMPRLINVNDSFEFGQLVTAIEVLLSLRNARLLADAKG